MAVSMSADLPDDFDDASWAEPEEGTALDSEDPSHLLCARCKDSFPDSELSGLPAWLAVPFRVFLPGAEDDLQALYCPPCRAYLKRIMASFVFIFGSVVVIAGVAYLMEYLGWM
jgi:hypothetical protein